MITDISVTIGLEFSVVDVTLHGGESARCVCLFDDGCEGGMDIRIECCEVIDRDVLRKTVRKMMLPIIGFGLEE